MKNQLIRLKLLLESRSPEDRNDLAFNEYNLAVVSKFNLISLSKLRS